MTIDNHFPLGALPTGPLQEIFEYLGPADLENVSLVNQRFNKLASLNSIWKPIAEKMDFPIEGNLDNIRKKVKDFVVNLKQIIKNFPENPKDIEEILENLNPIIENVKTLQGYCKARDIIKVWGQLSNEIGQGGDVRKLYEFKSLEEMIDESKGFNDWCDRYQNELDQIDELDLSGNDHFSLPKEIGKLTKLHWLHLNNNHFSSLPEEIGSLTHLGSLYLNNNQFFSLPKEIGKLTNLEVLLLQGNQLSSLPGEIGNLTNLVIIIAKDNQLSSLPKEIGNLKKLRMLSLENNQLSSIPKEIKDLSKISIISIILRDNPMDKKRDLDQDDTSNRMKRLKV